MWVLCTLDAVYTEIRKTRVTRSNPNDWCKTAKTLNAVSHVLVAALGYAITSRRLNEVYNDQQKNKYLNAAVIRPARSSRKLVEVYSRDTLPFCDYQRGIQLLHKCSHALTIPKWHWSICRWPTHSKGHSVNDVVTSFAPWVTHGVELHAFIARKMPQSMHNMRPCIGKQLRHLPQKDNIYSCKIGYESHLHPSGVSRGDPVFTSHLT